jgi:hypothetical protein
MPQDLAAERHSAREHHTAPGSNGCTLTDDELDRWIAGFPDCPERMIRKLMKHALGIKKCGWLLQAAGR